MADKEPDMLIRLNLNKLTQAHIEEARPNKGGCSYSAPCIIGALMTPRQREYLKKRKLDDAGIENLICDRIIAFPTSEQGKQARMVQYAFDCKDSATIDAAIKAINPKLSW
jgi:hypothetical protein